jgi:hypothetical protein
MFLGLYWWIYFSQAGSTHMTANKLASTAAQHVSLHSSGFRYDLFAAMCKSAHGRSHVRDYYSTSFINFCFVSNSWMTRSELTLKFFDFLLPLFYPNFISFVPSVTKNRNSDGGMKNTGFWDLARSILVKQYRRFGKTICLIFYLYHPSFLRSFVHTFIPSSSVPPSSYRYLPLLPSPLRICFSYPFCVYCIRCLNSSFSLRFSCSGN